MVSQRKILLRFLKPGDRLLDPISNEDVARLLHFLNETLNLSKQEKFDAEINSKEVLSNLKNSQTHRLALCIARMRSRRPDRVFEAFHELYDFIQCDVIDNNEPFNKYELIALKYLHDELTLTLIASSIAQEVTN